MLRNNGLRIIFVDLPSGTSFRTFLNVHCYCYRSHHRLMIQRRFRLDGTDIKLLYFISSLIFSESLLFLFILLLTFIINISFEYNIIYLLYVM